MADSIILTVGATVAFILLVWILNSLSIEPGGAVPFIPRTATAITLMFASVLIISQSYHILYGENTLNNYLPEGSEANFFDAFSDEIECREGHSAQLDYSIETECVEGVSDSHFFDTYEFTVPMTFLGIGLVIWFLNRNKQFRSNDNGLNVGYIGLLGVIASSVVLYGFPWISIDSIDQLERYFKALDVITFILLLAFSVLFAIDSEPSQEQELF